MFFGFLVFFIRMSNFQNLVYFSRCPSLDDADCIYCLIYLLNLRDLINIDCIASSTTTTGAIINAFLIPVFVSGDLAAILGLAVFVVTHFCISATPALLVLHSKHREFLTFCFRGTVAKEAGNGE